MLLIVDTLRADRLSAYGYEKGRTPHIDALATDGLLYLLLERLDHQLTPLDLRAAVEGELLGRLTRSRDGAEH
jgi:hypothetical protein